MSENMTKTVEDIKKIIKEPRNYGKRGRGGKGTNLLSYRLNA